jgi:hypothetical protein
MDSARLQPALLGGVFIGVLSALPFISAANCCCCLWVIGGGVLAVYLRQQNSAIALPASEGALMGLMAGFIGGIISGVLGYAIFTVMGPMQNEWLMRLLEANQETPAEFREAMERMMANSGAFALAGMVFNVVIYSVFGLLGGLLGTVIFKKNAPPTPPPPTVIPHDPGLAH